MKSINKNNYIVVSSDSLSQNNNCTFIIENKRTIIKGVVTTRKGVPTKGASIEVVQVNIYDSKRTVLGCTYTDRNGKYAFSILPLCNMIYEFIVYSPLVK
ncbi:hypothetical protein KPL42_03855 [Clostridium gasigenes]|uniref:hypothetical protein n=1 Tax=Clostridium gasigenes TaxID=94869 RepID=UPI001C0E5CFE|nr:hypothetical protein [Clostridium gasigenes]MBU3087625.1 hypothetical protein [Clostridium gasigenes]MBU3131826.1 hypothetical protein [Clostridium gasigenes]